jgi:putative chitinase
MRFVEFYFGGQRYRLTDAPSCDIQAQQVEVGADMAAIILRAALARPQSMLASQIRQAFAWMDGGRASFPTVLPQDLADRVGDLVRSRRLTLLLYASPEIAAILSPVPIRPVAPRITADQLRVIMTNAGARADVYVEALNTAMAAHGIDTVERQMAFLAQISVESGNLRNTLENLNYSAAGLMETWPGRFPTLASTQGYARNPEAIANHVYADRLGNGDTASGDGWRFRGRGLMQITGRSNYRQLGFEANPDALLEPATASDTAAAFWERNNLNDATTTILGREAFDAVSRRVNGGNHGSDARWAAYQRAQFALRPPQRFEPGGTVLPPPRMTPLIVPTSR